ncbi:MAG: glycosyltransferase family 2 protein [Ghiorsea sp.]
MKSANSLAVVISTYNKPEYLQLVLEGYRQQSSQQFSIYIADDGSKQDTKELIQMLQVDFPVQIHHCWHEDLGFRKSRIHNIAFAKVEEPYLLLTDGDCIPHPNLVQQHLHHAKHGHFMNGSRILLQKSYTQDLCSGEKKLPQRASLFFWINQRFQENINRIIPLLIPRTSIKRPQQLAGIRGCHLSCWKHDLLAIDGYDESFEGWGREDSDLVSRLFHAGIQRADLIGTPVFHLWHHEEPRTKLQKNDKHLQQCLREKRIKANKGISYHD